MIRSEITRDEFEHLLAWLAPDREAAGHKYQSIRERLIKIFYANGCAAADEMADETIDRVCRKVETLATIFEGDPAIYFYGVAKKLILEASRKPRSIELPQNIPVNLPIYEEEPEFMCLDGCLAKLSPEDRELITGYYLGDRREKIENRRKLAAMLEISATALRVKTLRLRNSLQVCVRECIDS